MENERLNSLWRPLTCLLMLLLNGLHSSVADMDVSLSVMCSGRFWCEGKSSQPASDETDPTAVRVYFQYSPNSGLCVEVEHATCAPATNCTFSSTEECYRVCGNGKKSVQVCAGTEYGCCGDGVTVRQGDEKCPEAAASEGDGGRTGVHWGFITSGVCGAVLLIGLVAVVGLSTYAYRQRHRNRRRWYIHEVLQMYDGGESSDSGAASDSSWDDPEHKNLFDRL